MRSYSFFLLLGSASLGLALLILPSAEALPLRRFTPPTTPIRPFFPQMPPNLNLGHIGPNIITEASHSQNVNLGLVPNRSVAPNIITEARAYQNANLGIHPFGSAFDRGAVSNALFSPFSLLNPVTRSALSANGTNPYGLSGLNSPYSMAGGYQSPYMMSAYGGGYGGGSSGGGGGNTNPYLATTGYQPQAPAAEPADVSQTARVAITDDGFLAASITIPAGTLVRWKNSGGHMHTVTSDTGLFDSRELDPGRSCTVFFAKPGTYFYHCTLHPDKMRGTIVVTE